MIVLSHKDLLEAGCFDIPATLKVVEDTLLKYSQGTINFPDKVSQIFDEQTQDRINCLPATLKDEKICGMKWVAVFPQNPVKHRLANVNASILLSEIETGFPIAFMDGVLCSDLRTASISTVAAKYLARENSRVIGFIGSGEQAKMHMIVLKHQFPGIKVCKVASRNPLSEDKFIDQLSKLYKDVEFIKCNSDYEMAARESDIVVTAISGQEPILQSEWLAEGVFYSHVGGWEDDYSVPLSVDKIVCDDWNSVKHRTQTISRLYKNGRLRDDDIYADLYEIVAGKKKGRTSENEKVYFNAVGLSYVDVALAYSFYKKAKLQATLKMDLNRQSLFDKLPENIVL